MDNGDKSKEFLVTQKKGSYVNILVTRSFLNMKVDSYISFAMRAYGTIRTQQLMPIEKS